MYLRNDENFWMRVIGDDCNHNFPDEILKEVSQLSSWYGMTYDVSERDNEYQTYNSQMLCIDDLGFPYLMAQNFETSMKMAFVPFETPQIDPNVEFNKFEVDVIRNMNYANQYSGDPLVNAITNRSIKKYGIVKDAKLAKIRSTMNPYKIYNIYTHTPSLESLELISLRVYKMPLINFFHLIQQVSQGSPNECDLALREMWKYQNKFSTNFLTDQYSSLFDMTQETWIEM